MRLHDRHLSTERPGISTWVLRSCRRAYRGKLVLPWASTLAKMVPKHQNLTSPPGTWQPGGELPPLALPLIHMGTSSLLPSPQEPSQTEASQQVNKATNPHETGENPDVQQAWRAEATLGLPFRSGQECRDTTLGAPAGEEEMPPASSKPLLQRE